MPEAIGLRGTCKAYSEVQFEFEPATATIWGYMKQRGNPCFNLGLLKDLRSFGGELSANSGHVEFEGGMHKAHYYVAASRVPKVYNLGGDLALFLLLIRSRDRDALAHYAKLCIDNIHARVQNYFCPTLTTISLVQGDALGGGFETALSSDVLVAEESAMLGLPEILFNLFPGMGAYSLLARRIGARGAEDLILSGKILPAAKLHEMGIVDVLAKDGEGEAAVQAWIAKNARRRSGYQAVMQVRQQVNPVTRAELDAVADTWVDCAMRLEDRDMRMMGRVVRAQMERMEAAQLPAVQAPGIAFAAG
ncbi:MAG: enoyl-CoA hydratase/isomerase family protein [Candidatus Parcubacteria bacterium]|nr:enoyl-CoA hydratase/isomerase family protein [Burkholderiales bacterium]